MSLRPVGGAAAVPRPATNGNVAPLPATNSAASSTPAANGNSSPAPAANPAPPPGTKGTKPHRKKWFQSTGMFYAASAAGHVACVVLLISLPLGFRARRMKSEPPINAEVTDDVENPRFNLPKPRSLADPGADPSGQDGSSSVADASSPDNSPDKDGSRAAARRSAGDIEVPVDIDTVAATKAAEKAIAAALDWFARHQERDGRWSLATFERNCQGDHCDQPGAAGADAAATGLALLPFFGAGHTQASSGPHSAAIDRGLHWLIEQQHPNGDLSAGAEGRMYPHAIATLALCENYALTRDRQIGAAAQLAVAYIVKSQNKATGGWHYEPGGLGNTSIVAWQMLALASARRGGLKVDPVCLSQAEHWLRSVAGGQQGGLFSYEPGRPVTATMTAIGILCRQLDGVQLDSPAMLEGREFLLAHLPASPFSQDIFYWYFGSPAMRGFGGADWQVWFHAMRRTLMETQCQSGCAAGSWRLDPPAPEAWSSRGGRLMVTSFAVQLLELEYGQLPLYAPVEAEPVRAAAEDRPVRR
jgi:hypothetical protein